VEVLKQAEVKKPIRAASGISVVAVVTAPFDCPAKCTYCFGGPNYGAPKSYIIGEPAINRAAQNAFNPYFQTQDRLKQYILSGHFPSKSQIIVVGGTFTALPKDYRKWFIAQCIKALNDFPKVNYSEKVDPYYEIRRNETALIRCVGISIETRPDWLDEMILDELLNLGVTRVEIGVQSTFDSVLERVKRGHGIKEVIHATKLLKDAGFEVCYHMMLGLPGSSKQMDIESFKTIFYDSRFCPDMIKIYPTLVMPGSELYKEWLEGKYKEIREEEVVEILEEITKFLPPYVRINRVQRDMPSQIIVAGIKRGDLREYASKILREKGIRCLCTRCREVGIRIIKEKFNPDNSKVKLIRRSYYASEGYEHFLSFEDEDLTLVGYLRLRIPKDPWRKEAKNAGIVRELHVYGQAVPIGVKAESAWQHKGYGRRLLAEAERIVYEEYGLNKMIIISAIGVREYYRKFGYELEGPYVSKILNKTSLIQI
jgi:elongator complex protein 3